ncbi:hypothetical protein ACN26Y_30040 [Micromonospora sp. WMMD558]|uniref:hypothetical protein n=1 Tax=unclassified Micromonospora TaxID=2617518 RepID=UPI0012B4D687|nr:hypothetical protein [Micromonospora sp. WMMC415]QGN50029.1 hypothetical protein GKC29_26545 [Micromonospora sp. WMMC415]
MFAAIPPADRPTSGPGYGQPTSGGPGYGQPTSGGPSYGQPTSGVPGYGQPAESTPYPQPGAFPPPQPGGAPARRSKLPLVLSLGLVGLLVLCLGGGGLAYVALSGSDEDPAPVPSSAPSGDATPRAAAEEETPSAEPSAEPRIRLVAPKTLGGRAKSTDPELRALADEMVRDMKSTVRSESGAVGAFYGSPEKQDMVMIAGASGFVLDPKRELDDAVKALSAELNVRRMSTVSPGPLGGVAKCGDGSASDIDLGVCVWADQGSVGMIVMFFSSASKAKSEFASIRGQVEKRS